MSKIGSIIIPSVIILFFPPLTVYLSSFFANYNHQYEFTYINKIVGYFIGSPMAYLTVVLLFTWTYLWIHLYRSKYDGKESFDGIIKYTPKYSKGGILYFTVSIFIIMIMNSLWTNFSKIYIQNFPYFLQTLNIISLFLCIYYYRLGKELNMLNNLSLYLKKSSLLNFYKGILKHYTFLNVDAKQFINSRFSMLVWEISIITFGFYYFHNNTSKDINSGLMVNIILQTIYLGKFYGWEEGYFNTLDITMDRLGFYIIWGCLVFVPFLYTLSTYYLVLHPPTLNWAESSSIMLFGLFAILMNYWVDYQKQIFREKNGDVIIWGSKAKFIETTYLVNEQERNGKLLISGFWGLCRHANYLFELMLAVAWCLPAIRVSFVPFLYPIFMLVLLVHRTFRDEKKCSEKYKMYWEQYCSIVKYRFIPYIF